MSARIAHVARNTFREAVRDRVLYNLIFFALLLVGASLLFGQISLNISRIVLINLGLTAISLFGVVIAIFLGIGLVSKEIEKRTLYTILSRPVRRWEFIVGKFGGLAWTLTVNTACMALGFFAALLYLSRTFTRADASLLIAIYFLVLEFFVITALALLFSSFSSPVLSAVMALAMFIIGTFSQDLRGFASMARGGTRVLASVAAYVVPNLAPLNVISRVAHDVPIAGSLVLYNTLYSMLYTTAAVCGAVLIFEHRNLK
jgi:ABC-type transport system involved in multi-copper enzyme maturation permease subunit